jgi:hypothetical protein
MLQIDAADADAAADATDADAADAVDADAAADAADADAESFYDYVKQHYIYFFIIDCD